MTVTVEETGAAVVLTEVVAVVTGAGAVVLIEVVAVVTGAGAVVLMIVLLTVELTMMAVEHEAGAWT